MLNNSLKNSYSQILAFIEGKRIFFFVLCSITTLDFFICWNGSKNTSHILCLWTLVVLVIFGKELLGLFPVEIDEEKHQQHHVEMQIWDVCQLRVPSLACSVAVFPVFWFCTVTVKNGGEKSTCSAFTTWFRKAYWKMVTSRISLILEELVLCSTLLAALCVLLHKQLVFPDLLSWPRLCCFSSDKKWRQEKKKKPAALFTTVRNLVSVVVSKKSLKKN